MTELVDAVGMHQPGVSRHLKVLRDAGLVEVRRDAQRRLYRLRAEPLRELDEWLEPYRAELAGRLDSLERHLERTAPADPPEGAIPVTDDLTTRYDGVLERTAGGGVIRFERHLAYDVRDVWDAITSPARLADWWLPFDADITVDLREGGELVFAGTPDGEPVTMTCTILRLEPPVLFEHTHPAPGSTMRWELEAGRHRLHPAAQPRRSRRAGGRRQPLPRGAADLPRPARAEPGRSARPRGTGPPSPRPRPTTPVSGLAAPVVAS